MDKILAIPAWLAAHWATIAGIAAALLSIVGTLKNLLQSKPKIESVLAHISDVLAWASAPGTAGVVGRFSVPGVPSRQLNGVGAKLPDPPGASMRAFLPFFFLAGSLVLFGVAAAGCATPGAQALGKCELGQLPQTLETVIAQVAAIVANPGDYVTDLENLGKGLGPNQLSCVEQAIAAALNPADPAQAGMKAKLKKHMAMHPGHACGDKVKVPEAKIRALASTGEANQAPDRMILDPVVEDEAARKLVRNPYAAVYRFVHRVAVWSF